MKIFLFLLLFFHLPTFFACDCNSAEDSVNNIYNKSSLIFTAKVISFEKAKTFDELGGRKFYHNLFTLEVITFYKGNTTKRTTVTLKGNNCSPLLVIGNKYLFYPYKNKHSKNWTLNMCYKPTRDINSKKVKEEINYLIKKRNEN